MIWRDAQERVDWAQVIGRYARWCVRGISVPLQHLTRM